MTATAVVTGLGVIAPNGLGAEELLGSHAAGGGRHRAGSAGSTRNRYPARLAGEVTGFDPAEHLPSRLIPQTDHMTRLALAAADWALADAGWTCPRARVRHGRDHGERVRRVRIRPA